MSNTRQEISNNLYEFYSQVAKCEGIYSDNKDRWAVISNRPGNWPRIIYKVSRDMSQHESTAELIHKVQEGLYPEVLIAIDDNIGKNDPFLRKKGFFPFLGWKGMAREFAEFPTKPPLPDNVEIVNLDHPEDLQQWATIVSTELIAPTQFEPVLLGKLMAQPGIGVFLLKHEGMSVSTILVYQSAHSTGLYMLATALSARRKGFAYLLMEQIIWQLTQQSKKPIILHATQKGEGLHAKLGFVPYNQFFLYRYLNPQL